MGRNSLLLIERHGKDGSIVQSQRSRDKMAGRMGC